MKKIVGLAAVAALLLAACTSAPTATETGIPTPPPSAVTSDLPEDLIMSADSEDPCTKEYQPTKAGIMLSNLWPIPGNWAAENNGTAFRYAYSSILRNATDVVAVCATVIVPNGQFALAPKTVNWAHGTVGLTEKCLPFRKANGAAQPLRAGGLGTNGAGINVLTNLMASKYVVIATDYYSGPGMGGTFPYQPYAAGVAEGAQVLDAMRAFWDRLDVTPNVQYVTWGHSQGGGSSLWAGQIAAKYLPGTKYVLRGVLAAAPATQFVATPEQDAKHPSWTNNHLGDRDAYNFIDGALPIGDVLFSYVMQPWSRLGGGGEWASLPSNTLDLTKVMTPKAVEVSEIVASKQCLDDISLLDPSSYAALLKVLSAFTLDPASGKIAADPFFADPFQGTFKKFAPAKSESAIDRSCLDNDPRVAAWCAALAWNMPGPNGINPYDKMPANNVPMFIASTLSDNVVWCESKANPPLGADCLAQQFVESTGRAVNGDNLTVRFYATAPDGKAPNHFGVMPASAKDSLDFITKALR